jgi:hypothetical protein
MLPQSSGSNFVALKFCLYMAFCFWTLVGFYWLLVTLLRQWEHWLGKFVQTALVGAKKCLRNTELTTFPVYWPKWTRRGTSPHSVSSSIAPFRKQSNIYTQHQKEPEYGGSMYLRNVGNIAHDHTAQQSKNRINISNLPRWKTKISKEFRRILGEYWYVYYSNALFTILHA